MMAVVIVALWIVGGTAAALALGIMIFLVWFILTIGETVDGEAR